MQPLSVMLNVFQHPSVGSGAAEKLDPENKFRGDGLREPSV